MNSDRAGRMVFPFRGCRVATSDLGEGLLTKYPWFRNHWVGDHAHIDLEEALLPEGMAIQVVSGPHAGEPLICPTPSAPLTFFWQPCGGTSLTGRRYS